MTFHWPSVWLLALLALTPLMWWRWVSSRRRAAVRYSSTAPLAAAGGSALAALRWAAPVLRTLAFTVLVVCLARPRIADEQRIVTTEGVAIQLIVDRSGSMRAIDFTIDGRQVNRLEAARHVVSEFVLGDGDGLPGRPHDLIGLIAFARYPDGLCPPTLDHEHLVTVLNGVSCVPMELREHEDGTAIGEALALGVERLRALDEAAREEHADRPADESEGEREGVEVDGDEGDEVEPVVRSKVIVLLTDGENNAGEIDPLTAAEIAHAMGVRVYCIGVGSRNSTAPLPVIDVFGREDYVYQPVSIDEETLRAIAERTGGQYFRATDTDSLREVYEQIDRLEKTEIEDRRLVRYTEVAVEPFEWLGRRWPPLLPIALVLLVGEAVLAHLVVRKLP